MQHSLSAYLGTPSASKCVWKLWHLFQTAALKLESKLKLLFRISHYMHPWLVTPGETYKKLLLTTPAQTLIKSSLPHPFGGRPFLSCQNFAPTMKAWWIHRPIQFLHIDIHLKRRITLQRPDIGQWPDSSLPKSGFFIHPQLSLDLLVDD